MRPAMFVAAAAALLLAAPPIANAAPAPAADPPASAPPDAAPGDPATADMRCIVVAAALLSQDDEQMKSLGRASLFYYIGRLQGRGDVANLNTRIVAEATKMSGDDIKAESKTCGAQFTAATQALQDLSDAFQKSFGAQGGAGGAGAAPK